MGPSYVLPWVPTPTSSSDGLWSVRWIKVLIPHIAFVSEFITAIENKIVQCPSFSMSKSYLRTIHVSQRKLLIMFFGGIVNVLGGQTWTLTIDTASLKCSSKQVICPNLFIGLTEFWCHFYVQLILRLYFLKKWLPSKLCYLHSPPLNAHQTCQSILCPDKGWNGYSFVFIHWRVPCQRKTYLLKV